MNIALFLHSQKEYPDSTLPLPLAPVYSLPHHKWHFSSPSLVPLRKRKQNSSLYKYIEEFQAFGEQQESNTDNHLDLNQNLLCLYQKNGYFTAKLNHIFETVWHNYSNNVSLKEKISCQCQTHSQQQVQCFKTTSEQLYFHLQNNKKNPKHDHPQTKNDQINWLELTRAVIHHNLKIPFCSEDHLHLYKLPQTTKANFNIFNLLWSNSFVVFNNGHQIKVNERMKSKAVELAEMINKKLKDEIWAQLQVNIQHNVESIKDAENFVSRLKQIATPNSFRLWFYKKQTNNSIYAIAISDLTFKGIDCILYKDIKPNQQISASIPSQLSEEIVDIVDNFLVNRIKTYTLNSQTTNLINQTSKREKLKSIASANKLQNKTLEILKRSTESLKKQEQPTEIQCACCRHLLLSTEIINQITAKHLQQIRYLRQFKMGKLQYDPYDFVKVCTHCYQIYLQHYQKNARKKEKKTMSFYQYKKKKEEQKEKTKDMRKENKSSNEQKILHEEKISKHSSKKLVKNYSCKTRTKSELNSSKEHTDFDKVSKKTKQVLVQKPKMPTYCLPFKYRKNKTTHTSNTETLDFQPSFKIPSIKQEFSLQRSMTGQHNLTQQDQPLNKSKSFKLRGRVGIKQHNLINKIISHSHNSEYSQNYISITQHKDENQQIRNQIITTAIQQYESVSRPSFKRLIYKNHRPLIKKQIVEDPNQNQESGMKYKRKSIKSYL